jgi:GTP diphosphokinase / guanosine-3',5'-bis(diphosphate) 3'-diphosphatase
MCYILIKIGKRWVLEMEGMIQKADYLTMAEHKQVQQAMEFAREAHVGQRRITGEPYITHPIEVCGILVEYKADYISLIAALLHDVVEDTSISLEEIDCVFGAEVALLVDGLTKVKKDTVSEEEYKASNFQKLLLVAEQDIRVAIIKLADRLHNMRTLSVKKIEKRIPYANETVTFFTPLAEKLGLQKMQAELEELAFMYLHPTAHHKMSNFISNYTTLFLRAVQHCESYMQEDKTCAIQAITWEKEAIYRAYSRLQEEYSLCDLFHIKLITDSPLACYAALGVLHQLFYPVDSAFEDHLAIQQTPFSKYLKTKVIIQDLEVTVIIQTERDYELEQEGVWNFLREASNVEQRKNVSTALLKDSIHSAQLISTNAVEFYDLVSLELFQREMRIFSLQLDVISLPEGATVLDFAFAFQPSVASRVCGAKVNGVYQPIGQLLTNMDVVELVIEKKEQIQADWLNHVYTSKAMHNILEALTTVEEVNG